MKKMSNKAKFIIILFIFLLITIYSNINYYSFYYKVSPIFNLIIFILILKFSNQKITYNYKTSFIILFISLFLSYCSFTWGLIGGYVKSPFNHNFFTIFKNIFLIFIPILNIEIIRFNTIKNNNKPILNILIVLLLFALELNYHFLLNLQLANLFKYLSGVIIPLIIFNFLNTYLNIKSQSAISLLIRAYNYLELIILPIFPYYNWYLLGIWHLFKTIIIYFVFKYFIFKDYLKNIPQQNNTLYIWLILAIIFLSFIFGLFKYKPLAILSNSMLPTFKRGDVIIYEKLKETELTNIEPNTIIVYNKNNKKIIHRIIERKVNNNEIWYITKGDNNTTSDLEKIYPQDILGIYRFKIKNIGYPTVWLQEYLIN